MQGDFKLMKDNVHLGTFTIDCENDVWIYTAEASHMEQQPLIFRMLMSKDNIMVLTGNAVRDWIVNRAPESNYRFIDALMERVGIKEYDPLAFVAYNGGRFNTDDFYIMACNARGVHGDAMYCIVSIAEPH